LYFSAKGVPPGKPRISIMCYLYYYLLYYIYIHICTALVLLSEGGSARKASDKHHVLFILLFVILYIHTYIHILLLYFSAKGLKASDKHHVLLLLFVILYIHTYTYCSCTSQRRGGNPGRSIMCHYYCLCYFVFIHTHMHY
jgi:hypothetical protein